MADLKIRIGAEDKASQPIKNVARATRELAQAQSQNEKQTKASGAAVAGTVVKYAAFAVVAQKMYRLVSQGVKDHMESDRVQKMLAMTVGKELAPAMQLYAERLERSSNQSAEQTMQMQMMLHRFGAAPDTINKTAEAVGRYARMTGTDAVRATEELLSSAATGRQAFKELGLQYDKTGSQAETVAAITQALGEKLGGEDKTSLAFRTEALSRNFGDMFKNLAAVGSRMESTVGIVDGLSRSMGWLAARISEVDFDGFAKIDRGAVRLTKHAEDLLALATAKEKVEQRIATLTSRGFLREASAEKESLARINAKLGIELKRPDIMRMDAEPIVGRAKKPASGKSERLSSFERNQKLIEDALNDGADRELEIAERRDRELYEQEEQAEKAKLAREAESYEKGHELFYAAMDERRAAFEREKQHAQQIGEQIGSAFAIAIAGQLQKLAAGEELSMEETIIDILSGVASVALTAAGYGFLAPVVGGAAALAKSSLKKHQGGWIDAPRFHDGAWVGSDERPAVLQTGERVLSRAEVRGMGGPGGVDAAARGGGITVNVQTLDGSTAREYFERQGGRALLNAVRTGRGAPSALFGGR